MKQLPVLFGALLAANTHIVLAAKPAPVIDVNGKPQASTTTYQSSLTLTEQLASVERKLDARNRAQISIQNQLTDLQSEVDEIRGVTELHTHKLEQILERQRELYQEIESRVSQAIETPAASTNIVSSSSSILPTVDYSANLTENQVYDHALNLALKEKKYDQAIAEFKRFNEKFPQSSFSVNAHYWLGQLLFNKGLLNEAENEFLVVVNQYPDSSKRPDSMLKLAMVAEKQNNLPKARNLYNEIIESYAGNAAAKLASTRLTQIK